MHWFCIRGFLFPKKPYFYLILISKIAYLIFFAQFYGFKLI